MTRKNSYIYLASPYSSSAKGVGQRMAEQAHRYAEAMRCFAWFANRHVYVYSPIVHCHPTAVRFGLPKDASYWLEMNTLFIDNCSGMLVLCIPGWFHSVGVQMEIKYALEHQIPITRIYPNGLGYSAAAYDTGVPQINLPNLDA